MTDVYIRISEFDGEPFEIVKDDQAAREIAHHQPIYVVDTTLITAYRDAFAALKFHPAELMIRAAKP